MNDPIEYREMIFGATGTYAVGCFPEFDPNTRILTVGPGILRVTLMPEEGGGLMDEFIFPGGKVCLPPETIAVSVGKRRRGNAPVLIVNIGAGIDDVTFRPIHLIYQYGSCWDDKTKETYMAHILRFFRLSTTELPQWTATKYGVPPTDMEEFRGDDADVHIQREFPVAVRYSMERDKAANEAKRALKNLLRVPAQRWTNQTMRQILLNLVLASPDIELPPALLHGLSEEETLETP